MDGFNQQFIFSIIIIGLGYLVKRTNILKERDGEALARIIFNLTLPSLIIVTFHDLTIEPTLLVLVIAAIVAGIFLSFIGILLFKKEQKSTRGMLIMMIPGYNVGLFAYPLVEGIWGTEGIKYFGLFDVGNAFIVFGLSYLLGSYYTSEETKVSMRDISLKLVKSIPLMTYMIVFLLNVLHIPLPSLFIDTASIISSANMPLSLLLLGVYLNFTFHKEYLRVVSNFLMARYGIGLLLGILLFILLPFEPMIRYTLLIGLILPIPVSALPYAVEFGYDKRFVGTVSNMTILLSFVLIWVIINVTF
ncbi:malonate transporter [Paraliobacillus quinghaiensis]|uniref:Malonate transporter n=1 Tax=Paraliobacillus quinghaiensis TaxID=470815 RepID=A0A917TEI6_9BACI|nr:AEC family transporter [Paraliobacillus quinghaiensis]GGM19418.1 malonate transporter [Paraliobacillus quinghaiensis]